MKLLIAALIFIALVAFGIWKVHQGAERYFAHYDAELQRIK